MKNGLPRWIQSLRGRFARTSDGWLAKDDLLRQATYRRLWTSILISSLGGQVTMLALPLTAAVLLHASPTQMGWLTAMEILPFVLFSLPTGVWLDRVRKLPVYIAGESALALVVAGVPLAWWLGWLSMPWMYVSGFVIGTIYTTAGTAAQIVLTQVVARQRLVDIENEARIRPRRLESRQMHNIAPQEEPLAAAFDHVAAMTGRMAWQRHHRDAASHLTAGNRARPRTVGSSGLLRSFRLRPLVFVVDLGRIAVQPELFVEFRHHQFRIREDRVPVRVDNAENVVGVAMGEEDRVDIVRRDPSFHEVLGHLARVRPHMNTGARVDQ